LFDFEGKSPISDLESSVEYLNQSLTVKYQIFGVKDHSSVAGTLNNLGLSFCLLGQPLKSIEFLTKSYEMYTRLFDQNKHLNPIIANTLSNLGILYLKINSLQKAVEYLNQAIGLYDRIYANKEPCLSFANALHFCGISYQAMDEHFLANELFNRSIEMKKKIFINENDPSLVATQSLMQKSTKVLDDILSEAIITTETFELAHLNFE
jgi:tetratricopeptide (TPR) repeat protein